MSSNAVKLTRIEDLAPGTTVNRHWNNAIADVYRLSALPVVPAGTQGKASISDVGFVVHGDTFERELHYAVSNKGSTSIDVDVWAHFWTDPGNTWSVTAKTLHAIQVQEDSGFPTYNDDEFYIALPWLRSTPGKAGSTSSDFSASLSEIEDIDPGNVRSIPASMGRVTFPNVRARTVADLLAGRMPELLVVVSVAFESDATPFGAITAKLKELAGTMKQELGTNIIEKISLTTSPDALKTQLEKATKKIVASMSPSFWEGLGLWLSSGSDPDDRIGYRTTLLVAADDELWELIKPVLSGTNADVRQLRHGATFQYTYAGDGAKYAVDFGVSKA